jgi:hypothetical protein
VRQCREHGLFLRDAGAMGWSLGTHSLRIAVKDAEANGRMRQILAAVTDELKRGDYASRAA